MSATPRQFYPFESLPAWDSADVDRFIEVDPVHGPQMKAIREAGKISNYSGLAGAGAFALFYGARTKSILGAAAGAVVGFFGGYEAGHGYTLFTTTRNINTKEVQSAFLQYWRNYNGIPQPEPVPFKKGRVSAFLGFR